MNNKKLNQFFSWITGDSNYFPFFQEGVKVARPLLPCAICSKTIEQEDKVVQDDDGDLAHASCALK